jgi:hypothetical protein
MLAFKWNGMGEEEEDELSSSATAEKEPFSSGINSD